MNEDRTLGGRVRGGKARYDQAEATVKSPHLYPKLRPVENVVVPDRLHGQALLLRDAEGIAPSAVTVPWPLALAVSRFNGVRSILQIAADTSRAAGHAIREDVIAELVLELDAACMLDTPRFWQRRREIVGTFTASAVRKAAHAGGAYHADPARLSRYIEHECLAKAELPSHPGSMVGLCAPHMDLWRAATGYGYAYRALLSALHPSTDTFILLGTSHAAMRRPFTVCDKVFDTPLGALEADSGAIHELTRESRFDIREEEYLHKNEHSIEFQVVFLRHLLGERRATIVPILCGLGAAQARGCDPTRDADAESFILALKGVVERRRGRVMMIAGADLAHVGPRFGDQRPLDAHGRAALEERDRGSIALALTRDARGFFAQVTSDLRTRRVCGLGPIYTMLRALPASRGEQLHYTQCVDAEEGSIVSHASLGFYAS